MDPPSRVQSFYHSAMMPIPWLCTLTEEEEEISYSDQKYSVEFGVYWNFTVICYFYHLFYYKSNLCDFFSFFHVKAASSVTFDLLIFEIMFLFFKNIVKKQKFRYTFYQFRKYLQIISIKTTAFMLKLDCL